MAFTRTKIVNCRRASIRRTPWIPLHSDDIVGIRDGPIENSITVKTGDTIEIDSDHICYDWTGRKFYKVRNPKGWIYEGCIDLGGDTSG